MLRNSVCSNFFSFKNVTSVRKGWFSYLFNLPTLTFFSLSCPKTSTFFVIFLTKHFQRRKENPLRIYRVLFSDSTLNLKNLIFNWFFIERRYFFRKLFTSFHGFSKDFVSSDRIFFIYPPLVKCYAQFVPSPTNNDYTLLTLLCNSSSFLESP